jgi:hypothetical protein
MRHLKTIMILAASLVLAVLLGLTGCDDDHSHHIRGDRDDYPRERHDGDRH